MVSNAELRALDRKVKDTFSRLQSMTLPANDRHVITLKLPQLLKKIGSTRRHGCIMHKPFQPDAAILSGIEDILRRFSLEGCNGV
jgi:hypothetical protein